MVCTIIGLITVIGYFGSSYVNETSRESELIVMFQKGTVMLPQGKTSAQISEVNLPLNIREMLISTNAESIAHCFPEYDSADTITISVTGAAVKKIDLSRVYRIKYSAGTNLDEIIDGTKEER